MKNLFILVLALTLTLALPVSRAASGSTTPVHANGIAGEHDVPALILAATDEAAGGHEEVYVDPDDFDDEDLSFLDDEEDVELNVYDPFETINRGTFWFNDKMYFYLFKPVARGYRWVMPEPLMLGFRNFFSNLESPIRIVSAGLQGKFTDAGNELTRFAVNTTLGIGGFFDTAKHNFNLKKKDEDIGQMLGYYGVGPGPYLVIPFFGPSNFRDGTGRLAGAYMDLMIFLWDDRDYWSALVVKNLNALALDKDTYEGIKKDALDPYLFIRDAYAQYRQNKVEN